MNGYLLDTNAISLFSPLKVSPDPAFTRWVEEQDRLDAIYLSVITVHEIEKGIRLLEYRGATARAQTIQGWLNGLIAGYGEKILPVDNDVALASGRLEAAANAAGHGPGAADAMIAGTAQVHGLTIITHNLRHFEPFSVAAESPQQIAP